MLNHSPIKNSLMHDVLSRLEFRVAIVLILLSSLFYMAALTFVNFNILSGIYVSLSSLMTLSPLLIGPLVYISSRRDTHDELHQLLTLTNLTNAAIVRGYLL